MTIIQLVLKYMFERQAIFLQKSLAKNNKNTLLMTQGNIWKLLITFSIPLIIGNLLQQMYNTADSIIVGNFVGSNGLAAVGSGTALINLIIAFAGGSVKNVNKNLLSRITNSFINTIKIDMDNEAISKEFIQLLLRFK